MRASLYKKIRGSARVRLEDCGYVIYARPEQLEQYMFEMYGRRYFWLWRFLDHVDSYRTCGYVWKVPLDNVRVVTRPPEPEPEQADRLDELVHEANRARAEEKERAKNRAKAVGWRISPPPRYRVEGST